MVGDRFGGERHRLGPGGHRRALPRLGAGHGQLKIGEDDAVGFEPEREQGFRDRPIAAGREQPAVQLGFGKPRDFQLSLLLLILRAHALAPQRTRRQHREDAGRQQHHQDVQEEDAPVPPQDVTQAVHGS